MIIPVSVQKPNKPDTMRFVGHASDDLTPEQVAKHVGVPAECFIYDAKIMKHRKGPLAGVRHWSLVADVSFRSDDTVASGVCPHCGGAL